MFLLVFIWFWCCFFFNLVLIVFTWYNRLETASSADNEDSKLLNPRKNLEEEYLDYEAKVHIPFAI